MKPIFSFFTITFILAFSSCGQSQSTGQTNPTSASEYKNEVFHFSVKIPMDWKLHGQIKNDTIQKRAVVQWGIPSTYSELEKTYIENSISITAYHRTDIKSADELITFEYLRKDLTETSLEVDSTSRNARIVYSTINGLNYKGKIYFVFKNDIGYVVTFMATPGTYDKNIRLFEDFNNKITYF